MVDTKELKTAPKISVKIWKPIIKKLESNLKAQCLRRDSYLAKVLKEELDHLDSEVSIPNSQASYDHVFQQLDLLDRWPVSLALPPELTQRLNEICARKRIVRDAFFNRLFLLLALAPRGIDSLLFSGEGEEWRTMVWRMIGNDRSIFENTFYPLNDAIDPFWFIRIGLDLYAEKTAYEDYVEPTTGKTIRVERSAAGEVTPPYSLYTALFNETIGGKQIIGLNCYLPDSLIPGHEAQIKRESLDELFGGF